MHISDPLEPLDSAPLLALVGPTASGKSALAVKLALRLEAEILSLDSMSVYRGLDCGTAKPSPADREQVRHHLIDVADPQQRYDVRSYLEDVRRSLRDIHARGKRALFVGGTGFYWRALTHDLFAGPAHDPQLREKLNLRAAAEGSPRLHAELMTLDPGSAARIHPNDQKRVVRALEVLTQSGKTLSDWQAEWRTADGSESPGRHRRMLGLDPPRDLLAARIKDRVRQMLERGWIEEVRRLQAAGSLGPTAGRALGYPEIAEHLAGRLSLAELIERISAHTRRFARSQRTWFRRYPEICWAPAGCFEHAESEPRRLLDFALEAWRDLL